MTLNFNYYRFDNDYKDWNVWVWEDGRPGKSFDFNKLTSFGAVAQVNISDNALKTGFIIRKGEWEKKDIDADRYIDISQNIRDIFLVSGEKAIYFKEEHVDKSNRITGALIMDDDVIKVSTTVPVDIKKIKEDIFIDSDNVKIPIKDIYTEKDPSDKYFTVKDNKVIIKFNPEDFGLSFNEDTQVFLTSSMNSWQKKDSEFNFIKKGNIFYLEREMGISKNQISLNTEFKFFVLYGSDERWFPDNNIILKSTDSLSNSFYVKTLRKLLPEKKYSVNITGLLKKAAVPYSVLENYKFDGWLGYRIEKGKTIFRLWSPVSEKAFVRLFDKNDSYKDHEMKRNDNIFELSFESDLSGIFYQYSMIQYGSEIVSADPWCFFSGINGEKSYVGDLRKTDPEGFKKHKRPVYNKKDIILYEAHIRDFTVSENSGIKDKCTYQGFSEENTFLPDNKNITTGISHLKELGITHLHILPVMDFASVDEKKGGYNWGYDPFSYFSLEGSYSKEPQIPEARMKEFKTLVKNLHNNNISIIMDVVYNHTFSGLDSTLSKTVPYYYYRISDTMEFGNGSGCGNETASEHYMFRKHMIDSMSFFIEEYKVDGFRFDLMALHDVESMYFIENELKRLFPQVILYGEPWNGGPSLLAENNKFYKGKQKGKTISVFNDNFRNSVKGDTDGTGKGYVTGDYLKKNDVIKGLLGAIDDFAYSALETINYVSCHDNLTLTDKLKKVFPNSGLEELSKRATLANTFVMFAQGIPFIHSGVEFLRSKGGNHNSYNSGDDVNKLNWEEKEKYYRIFSYYREIIRLRKELECFKYEESNRIKENIKILDTPEHIIGLDYSDKNTVLFFNVSETGTTIYHKGNYKVLLNGLYNNSGGIMKDYITLPALSAVLLKKGNI